MRARAAYSTALLLAGAILGASVAASLLFLSRAGADGIPADRPLFYSGALVSPTALPDGAHSVTVRLWTGDAGDASAKLKCESPAATAMVVGGRFRVPLNQECVDAVRANADLFAEAVVDGRAYDRHKLSAVPY